MDFTQTGTVFAIVMIAYFVGMAAKRIPGIMDELIPVIAGSVGGILGFIGMYVMPNFPANNILDAIAVGIASGLAATGANQAIKQIKKG